MNLPIYYYFLAAIGWAGLCANFIVIPFFSRDDGIFKDLIQSNTRDLALSYIDLQKLLPALVRLIEEANLARDRHARRGERVEYEDLLLEVDFLPYLERAQNAIEEKRWIDEAINDLRNLAERLWQFGAVHSISIILLPFINLFLSETLRMPVAFVLVSVAVVTIVGIISALMSYTSRRRELYNALTRNRG